MAEVFYRAIGTIYSPFTEPHGMPIHTVSGNVTEGKVELFPEFGKALQDLEGFSHIFLIYHFHRAKPFQPLVKPFVDTVQRGLFATRSPARPNPIGLSVVELLEIHGLILRVKGIDIIDGTPLLDIKPYIPEFDTRTNCRTGWFADKAHTVNALCADDRFTQTLQ